MILALSIIILGLLAVLVISHQLERAPEGFEDERGFHVLAARTPMATPSAGSIARASEVVG